VWGEHLCDDRSVTILRQAGMLPPGRAGLCWRAFLRAQAHSMIALRLLHGRALWLGRLYVLFFIELGSRGGIWWLHRQPERHRGSQQARQLAWSVSERLTPIRFLITIATASSARS
jgi:hypothetical protein